MRPILLALLLTASAAVSVRAQSVSAQSTNDQSSNDLLLRPYLGIQGGITYSQLIGAKDFGIRYDYDYSPGQTALLHFDNFGHGISPIIGLSLQYPLSKKFGFIGRLNYVTLSTHNTETATRASNPEMNGASTATTTNDYTANWNYAGIEALLRFTLVPSSLYMTGGFGVTSLLSNRLNGSSNIESGNFFTSYYSSGGYKQVTITDKSSSEYYQSLRGDIKLGLGSVFAVSPSILLTPELSVSVPLTALLTPSASNIATSNGAQVPNLYYAALTVGINFPIGAMRDFPEPLEVMSVTTNLPASQTNLTNQTTSSTQTSLPSTRVTGTIRDERTGAPIRATVTATDLIDGTTAYTTETDADGNYTLDLKRPGKYSITAEAPGHLFRSVPEMLEESDRTPRNLSLSLSDVHGTTPLLVFYGFNDATLAKESEPELARVVRLMTLTPDMQIEVSGHTDTIGSSEYNKSLSERRAQSVRAFLVEHGVDSKRIIAIGRGEDAPVASNATEEGRAKNRRVELKVK